MSQLVTNILKNLGCSYCQEYEFQDNSKEKYKDWSLYLKEYEMYSAMILYNETLDKNISEYFKKGEYIALLDDKEEIIMKVEYLLDNEDENGVKNAILVPTDDYNSLYEKMEQSDKKFDTKLKASFIGKFNIKKCK